MKFSLQSISQMAWAGSVWLFIDPGTSSTLPPYTLAPCAAGTSQALHTLTFPTLCLCQTCLIPTPFSWENQTCSGISIGTGVPCTFCVLFLILSSSKPCVSPACEDQDLKSRGQWFEPQAGQMNTTLFFLSSATKRLFFFKSSRIWFINKNKEVLYSG